MSWLIAQFASGPFDCVWWMRPVVLVFTIWLMLAFAALVVAFLGAVLLAPLFILNWFLS